MHLGLELYQWTEDWMSKGVVCICKDETRIHGPAKEWSQEAGWRIFRVAVNSRFEILESCDDVRGYILSAVVGGISNENGRSGIIFYDGKVQSVSMEVGGWVIKTKIKIMGDKQEKGQEILWFTHMNTEVQALWSRR